MINLFDLKDGVTLVMIHCYRIAVSFAIVGALLILTSTATLANTSDYNQRTASGQLLLQSAGNSAQSSIDGLPLNILQEIALANSNNLSVSASGPLVVQLKYLKADKVQPILVTMFQNRIRVEFINNTLMIIGTDEDYAQIKALLAKIDIPPRQIMFEAEAVEVSLEDEKNLGIDWGMVTSLPGAQTYDGSNFRIGLGIPNHPEYGININATINRLIESKKGRLLASPRIATLDGQTAKILIGDRLAVESRQVVDGSEIISVTYIDVGIKLEVTPTVNEDGTITTVIKPEVSNKTDATKNGNPNIRTRQAETTLRVRSGETIVIGGLIQREENSVVNKFPLIGNVPLVGHLFRSNHTEKKDTELVILITPKEIDL